MGTRTARNDGRSLAVHQDQRGGLLRARAADGTSELRPVSASPSRFVFLPAGVEWLAPIPVDACTSRLGLGARLRFCGLRQRYRDRRLHLYSGRRTQARCSRMASNRDTFWRRVGAAAAGYADERHVAFGLDGEHSQRTGENARFRMLSVNHSQWCLVGCSRVVDGGGRTSVPSVLGAVQSGDSGTERQLWSPGVPLFRDRLQESVGLPSTLVMVGPDPGPEELPRPFAGPLSQGHAVLVGCLAGSAGLSGGRHPGLCRHVSSRAGLLTLSS